MPSRNWTYTRPEIAQPETSCLQLWPLSLSLGTTCSEKNLFFVQTTVHSDGYFPSKIYKDKSQGGWKFCLNMISKFNIDKKNNALMQTRFQGNH